MRRPGLLGRQPKLDIAFEAGTLFPEFGDRSGERLAHGFHALPQLNHFGGPFDPRNRAIDRTSDDAISRFRDGAQWQGKEPRCSLA